jgi:hypothetical protein
VKNQKAARWTVLSLTVFLAVGSGAIETAVTAAPVVTLTSPTTGSILTAPASFTLRASVADGGNDVSQIEFFQDSTSLGVDTSNPYRIEVNNLPGGTYTFTAILTDNAAGTSTNSVSIIVNELPTVAITNPADGAGLIAPASFALEATAADLDGTVTQVQFFRGSTSLRVLTTAPYSVPVKNLAAGDYKFDAVATDNLGGTRRASIDVTVKQRPTIVITAPTAAARLTLPTNILTGTASDSIGVTNVEFSVNDGAFAPANPNNNGKNAWNDWDASLMLPAGTNVLRVRATDQFGNYSLTNSRSVFQVLTSALNLTITGSGTVSGATNGQFLEVGRGYRLVATPDTGYLFSNWTGTASGSTPTLSFLMSSNLSLQAHFVPNPFLRVGGTYNGLFFETNGLQHESSGDFRLRVTSTGNYNVKLRLAGRRYAVKGKLDLEGNATNVIVRVGITSLTIHWKVDLNGMDRVTGNISDGLWLSQLVGDRALFNAATNPASLAGGYTFVLPGSPLAGAPDADGWGTLKISSSGLGLGGGALPDGTKFRYKAPISRNGAWPLYVPLYLTKGSLIGWLQFDTNAPLDDVTGWVAWFKPAQLETQYYPAGFTNLSALIGSRYVAPVNSSDQVLAMTNGVLTLSGGNLSQAWVNDFVLEANNQVFNASSNRLTVTISRASGLFQGIFLDTGVNRTVNFSGALLQKSSSGRGFFLGTDQAGRVQIEKRP